MATYYTNAAVRTAGQLPSGPETIRVNIALLMSDITGFAGVLDDVINLRQFPTGCGLVRESFKLTCETADVDSNVSTTLLWNVQTATAEDGTGASIIGTNLDVAEVADTAGLDSTVGVLDVGDKFLQLHVDTAAATFGSTGVLRVEYELTRLQATEPYAIQGVSVETGTTA